jgi:hypothetical protein
MSNTTGTPTLARSIVRGTVGFTILSLGGFAVWAFWGRWFYRNVGEAGLYAVSAIVFLGFSAPLLHRLLTGPRSFWRFYKIFIPAFLSYAVVWSVCWFAWKFGLGEWLGSFFGCLAFAAVVAAFLKNWRAFPPAFTALFVLHTAGYFAGDWAYKFLSAAETRSMLSVSKSVAGTLAKFGWGLFYGLGFGAGIGAAFHWMQEHASRQGR